MSCGPLGQSAAYASEYDPSLLFPIPRAQSRAALGLGDGRDLPFVGADIWNAYELSWLDAKGKPRVAMATFIVPADSPNLIESKSLKLYLNSFNQTRLADPAELSDRLKRDLSIAAGATVGLDLILPERFDDVRVHELDGCCIDELDVGVETYHPAPQLLSTRPGEVVEETLCSRLLKSNCPVTGQPDWASVQVQYRGTQLDRIALLRYLCSFREHAGFHEHCVERIFCDISEKCRPEKLSVYARYTRRGGLDINPWRSNFEDAVLPEGARTARQ